jgi:hypothetical protein
VPAAASLSLPCDQTKKEELFLPQITLSLQDSPQLSKNPKTVSKLARLSVKKDER